jgi:hypothetical protein
MDSTQPQLPTRWLTFWSLIRLPLGAGVILWQCVFILSEPKLPPMVENLGNAGLLLAVFALLVGSGLRNRQARAFEDNWYIVFGEPILWTWAQMPLIPAAANVLIKSLCLFVILLIFLACWCWPNYIYFKKREHLFH